MPILRDDAHRNSTSAITFKQISQITQTGRDVVAARENSFQSKPPSLVGLPDTRHLSRIPGIRTFRNRPCRNTNFCSRLPVGQKDSAGNDSGLASLEDKQECNQKESHALMSVMFVPISMRLSPPP